MFRKTNVIDFLYDVIKDETLEIYPYVKYKSMPSNVPCQNLISKSKYNKNLRVCELSLNRKYFTNGNEDFLKASILHEIGHAVFASRSKINNEFFAHLWAIEKAEKMGLPLVVQKLILMILEWGKFDWKDVRNRRYILANKKFVKLFDSV